MMYEVSSHFEAGLQQNNVQPRLCRRRVYVLRALLYCPRISRYQQHYARYLKKKMSQNEFRLWADYALELKQRAYDKEMSFEEYAEEIRK